MIPKYIIVSRNIEYIINRGVPLAIKKWDERKMFDEDITYIFVSSGITICICLSRLFTEENARASGYNRETELI